MIRRTVRGIGFVMAALLALVLTACVSIPDSGIVHQGRLVTQADDQLDLDFAPSSPENRATPERIVQGFIDAASSPKNNFEIAREYLTRSMRASWKPDESVTVDDGRNRTFGREGSQWSVSVIPVASVDRTGVYRLAASKAPIGFSYQLEKEDGQWRISLAPAGIVIDDPTFRAVYSQQTLYFYNADYSSLVPDARWFPARVAAAATRVASAVLAGPTKWLHGAVASAFPQGTQLAVPAVTIVGGVARVDLSAEAGQSDQLQLQRMQAQLEQSLQSLASSVQLSIEGNVQQILSLSGGSARLRDPPVDSDPIVYRGDRFGLFRSSTITDLNGLSDKVVALQPSAVTVNAARDEAAVLSHGAVVLVRKSGDPVHVDTRPDLVPPALDNEGWVWSVPATAPNAVQVAGANGQAHVVNVAWPGAIGIVSFAVSRDGARVVAVLRTTTGYSLVAAGVVRAVDGLPTSLTESIELSAGESTPHSVAWTSELTVAVIVTTSADATEIVEPTIGGTTTKSTGPAGGTVIVGAGGLSRYVVLAADGTLQAPTGSGWQTQADKVGAVAVQLGQP